MQDDDYDALLDELDGIDHSPIRPWKTPQRTNETPSKPVEGEPIKPFTIDPFPVDSPSKAEARALSPKGSPTSPKSPKSPKASSNPEQDNHDVEDEIAGLLGDLEKLEETKGDPLASSVANRVSGGANGDLLSDSSQGPCCKRISLGSAEEQGQRPTMEDKSVLIGRFFPKYLESSLRGPRALCGVFDGHNGAQVADYAASRLPAALQDESWYSGPVVPSEKVMRSSLEKAFARVDGEVLEAAARGDVIGGATANVALLIDDRVYVCNIGDARCVLSRGGIALPLSVDHKPDSPEERKRIEALDGRVEFRGCWRVMITHGVFPRGLAVSRALGDLDWKVPKPLVEGKPDIVCEQIRPEDDFIIIGCDGVWDVLSNQEAVDMVRPFLQVPSEEAAQAAAGALVHGALSRGSADNVSVVIMRFHW